MLPMKNTIINIFLPLMACFALLFASCADPSSGSDNGNDSSTDYQKTWTISGTIDFSGCSDTDEADVKFAAIYDDTTIVSNIVTLGNSEAPGVDDLSFTLTIDASSLSPDFNGSIALTAWQDDNDNDLDDDSWSWDSKANSGSPYFKNNSFCKIWFNNSELYGDSGWKITGEDGSDGFPLYTDITASVYTFAGVDLSDGGYVW